MVWFKQKDLNNNSLQGWAKDSICSQKFGTGLGKDWQRLKKVRLRMGQGFGEVIKGNKKVGTRIR